MKVKGQKKVILLVIFNLTLVIYFLSLLNIREGIDAIKLQKRLTSQQESLFPEILDSLSLSEWGSPLASNKIDALIDWLDKRQGHIINDNNERELSIRQKLEAIDQTQLKESYQDSYYRYEKSLKLLQDLVSQRRWATLQSLVDQIIAQADELNFKTQKLLLSEVLDVTLASTLSQENKEIVLSHAAQVEKDIVELEFMRQQFLDWESLVLESKMLARLQPRYSRLKLETYPFESIHLILAGVLLFLIINSWIFLSDFSRPTKRLSVLNFRNVVVDILKDLTHHYGNSDIPYRVTSLVEGQTILPRQINQRIAHDLFQMQKMVKVSGTLSTCLKERPTLNVKFQKIPQNLVDISISPVVMKTASDLIKMGGDVEWEAQFFDSGEIKDIHISYKLPEAITF